MKTKKWIIAAICFIVAGGIIFVSMMSIINWDFNSLDTTEYITKVYRIDESFKKVLINANESNITFVKGDSECLVDVKQPAKVGHTAKVQNETLTIEINDTRKWYEQITVFSFRTPEITVHLPQDEYESLVINSSTGNIEIPNNFSFKSVDIKASTGDVNCKAAVVDNLKIKLSTGQINVENTSAGNITLTTSTGQINAKSVECSSKIEANVSTGKTNFINIKCNNLISNGSTGDITLKDVDAAGVFEITRSTGDIKFDGCDAKELYITTDTGDVSGTLLTDKVFICRSETGDIDVPKTITGGRCEITTDTGDIQINVGK
ncbi:MAG: DUF4097 family beta strand repeat protein [Clostridia bacterium]|nr:DUF4097 family beta strand repeat protein [Clostridia bacterium]